MALQIGTKSQIIHAMQMVNNKNDINEVADYLAYVNQKEGFCGQTKRSSKISQNITDIFEILAMFINYPLIIWPFVYTGYN